MFDTEKRSARMSATGASRTPKHADRLHVARDAGPEPAIELSDAQLDMVVGGISMIPPKKPSITYM